MPRPTKSSSSSHVRKAKGDRRKARNTAPPLRAKGQNSPLSTAQNGVWLYGRHAVDAALSNPKRSCLKLVATTDSLNLLDAPAHERAQQIESHVVEKSDIDTFLPPDSLHQGLALCALPLPSLHPDDLVRMSVDDKRCTVIILDRVTDPRNIGAVLRSAAAFGVLAVILPDRHAPEETGALAKAASGALEHVPLVRVSNLARAITILQQGGFWIAGMTAHDSVPLHKAGLSGKVGLVLGSEGTGMRSLTEKHCDLLVHLPMENAVESLNISSAAAIGLYELYRTTLIDPDQAP